MNPYEYAGSNPVMNSDPSGLFLQPSGLIPFSDNQLSRELMGYNSLNISIDHAANRFLTNQNNLNAYSNLLAKDDSASINRIYTSQPNNPIQIMQNRYSDMKKDNTIGNDKYFHCLVHCEASAAGGVAVSHVLGVGREVSDMGRPDKWRKDWQGDFSNTWDYKWKDTKADMDANRKGREGGKTGNSCYSACNPYVVPGINKRYLKNGSP